MVVWFAHVRVGHRQLPIKKTPLTSVRGVFLWGVETGDTRYFNLFSTFN